jgi:hypothetical protein
MSDGDQDEPQIATDIETPVDDAGSTKGYVKKLNAIEIRRLEAQQFWSWALESPIGRRELWGILQEAHVFGEHFACGPNGFPQPEATWFHAGEQSLGMRLFLSWQVLSPEGVLKMLQEHDSRYRKPAPPQRKRRADG